MPTQGIAVPDRQETSQAASFTPGQFRYPRSSGHWLLKGAKGSFRPRSELAATGLTARLTGSEQRDCLFFKSYVSYFCWFKVLDHAF